MTIQEKAIEQLERISEHLAAIGEKEDYTDIAIQALEQQPCEDCISRQKAIDTVVFECGGWIGLAREISKQLRQLPPVTPSYNSIKTELKPCEDCISRADVRKLICKNNDKYGYSDRFHKFTNECLNLPSVTPQPKMGRWVEENINEWSRKVFCSECGCLPPFEHISNGDVYSASGYGVINKTKFCPNCGVKMEVEE